MSEVSEGASVRIRFDGSRCIHARNCVLGLPHVFRANVEGDWIDPDGAPADEIFAAAARCPSGAIQVERIDGAPNEAPSGRNVVAVLENGPSNGSLTLNADGSFTYTPSAKFFGTDSFTYFANDGSDNS